jgi:hypothetical protein
MIKDIKFVPEEEMQTAKLDSIVVETKIAEIERTIEFARVRSMPFRKLLDHLKRIGEVDNPALIIDRFCELEIGREQEKALIPILEHLSREADNRPAKKKSQLDRYLRRLLRQISPRAASLVAGEFFEDHRKARRQIAFDVFRHIGLTPKLSRKLIQLYQKHNDQGYLELIARHPSAITSVDHNHLLRELEDKYWRARVIQVLLEKNVQNLKTIAKQYPYEFVHAVGRTKNPALIPEILDLFKENKSDIEFLSIFTWCLGVLGADKHLKLIEQALTGLKEPLTPDRSI